MSKTVLVPIADGTEEIEAVTLIDILRRAGADVTVASVDKRQITASRGVKIVADCLIDDCRDTEFDLVVLPGGIPGAEHLRDDPTLTDILARQHRDNRWYGAICAAPAVVLQSQGLLKDRQATSHPGFADRLDADRRSDSAVVIDGNCATSQGPGTAMAFALELVALLYGQAKAEEVAAPMVIA